MSRRPGRLGRWRKDLRRRWKHRPGWWPWLLSRPPLGLLGILRALPGLKFVEMARNRDNAWCCGAGGGVRTAFTEWAAETAGLRAEEAADMGASRLVSACPFCFQNLSAGIDAIGAPLKMTDLTSLVLKGIKGKLTVGEIGQ